MQAYFFFLQIIYAVAILLEDTPNREHNFPLVCFSASRTGLSTAIITTGVNTDSTVILICTMVGQIIDTDEVVIMHNSINTADDRLTLKTKF